MLKVKVKEQRGKWNSIEFSFFFFTLLHPRWIWFSSPPAKPKLLPSVAYCFPMWTSLSEERQWEEQQQHEHSLIFMSNSNATNPRNKSFFFPTISPPLVVTSSSGRIDRGELTLRDDAAAALCFARCKWKGVTGEWFHFLHLMEAMQTCIITLIVWRLKSPLLIGNSARAQN